MSETISILCVMAEMVLISLYFIRALLSSDKSLKFSPVSVVSLVYIYYCIMPYFSGGSEHYYVKGETNIALFHVASLLFYVSMLWGFRKETSVTINRWNQCFSTKNAQRYALLFFAIAFVAYSSLRGIHFSIFAADDDSVLEHQNFEHYILELFYLYEIAFLLFIIRWKTHKGKKWFLLLMIYIVISFVFAGTRARLVILVVSSLTVYYLYPKPKKMNYTLVAILAIVVYLGFSIMDKSRQYSKGLNRDAIENLSYGDVSSGAEENAAVYWFSAVVMDWCTENYEYVFFEPFLNAILSPVPRSAFPWKPEGKYLMYSQEKIIGTADHGAIFLVFTEAYYAFSWFGVIAYGFFFGWLINLFWTNYKRNPNSIGACIALALFSGYCYNFISRGYMATALINFIYIICLPFWIASLIGKLKNKKKIQLK